MDHPLFTMFLQNYLRFDYIHTEDKPVQEKD